MIDVVIALSLTGKPRLGVVWLIDLRVGQRGLQPLQAVDVDTGAICKRLLHKGFEDALRDEVHVGCGLF